MKRYFLFFGMAATMALPSCVKNPYLTEDKFLNEPNAAKTWASGIKRQLATTTNAVVVNAELISDNYFNNYTQNSKVFDIPQIDYFDVDVNTSQVEVQRLREMAVYGLGKVVPVDPAATAQDKAIMYFALAYSYLLSGEMFVALPISAHGEVLSSEQLLQKALTLWDDAIANEPDATKKIAYTLLKARTYYRLGDATNASNLATQVLAQKNVLLQVQYDGQNNGVTNEMQTGTFVAQPNRFAPLPRLDFLDPKYFNTGVAAAEQKPIAIAKGEEAYLIIAESQIAANDFPAARQTMKNMISEVVSLRTITAVDDSKETRNGGNRKDYPLTAVKVKFDENDSPRDGYVLNRTTGKVNAYTVSGTKVTDADIDAAATQDDMMYILYRLRQEIFMSEGRRMADLGIKFPVSQTEQLNNPNVKDEHIKKQLPSFIPLNRGMDDFTVEAGTGTVTMRYDMNKVLVQNKSAKEIFPFLN
jgi:tetratricopeptide (TPR) repeat protein